MYGWDSYFIILGLLREGKLGLAQGMVENFFYEIEHYGGILNANRTYYFTRSQPPFLSSMIRDVYEASSSNPAQQAKGKGLARPRLRLRSARSRAVDQPYPCRRRNRPGALLRHRQRPGARAGGRQQLLSRRDSLAARPSRGEDGLSDRSARQSQPEENSRCSPT